MTRNGWVGSLSWPFSCPFDPAAEPIDLSWRRARRSLVTTPIDDEAPIGADEAVRAGAGTDLLLDAARAVGATTDSDPADGATTGRAGDRTAQPRPSKQPFRRRRRKTFSALVVVLVLLVPLVVTYARALAAPGSESFEARTVGWLRDMKLGFVIDRIEQEYYERDQFADGGTPEVGIAPIVSSPVAPSTSSSSAPPTSAAAAVTTTIPTTTTTIPHLTPPARMATPADVPLDQEGEWFPVGPPVGDLSGVYVTKVRPNAQKSSLLVFVAWIDPKLVEVKLFPGTNLPGGQWETPSYLSPEYCSRAILAANGGFRMDQSRGGYYAEGFEKFPLRDGAASLIFFKDGSVDVAEWGRDYTHADLERISSVRQNLELMADGGAPAPRLDGTDWGALLANTAFVWRSGYGVTADGALVYAGGPALTPGDLVRTLTNAGAVRVMQGDINPDWVVANLYSVDAAGQCAGTSGLPGAPTRAASAPAAGATSASTPATSSPCCPSLPPDEAAAARRPADQSKNAKNMTWVA